MAPQIGTVGQRFIIHLEDDIVDSVDILQIGTGRNVVGDLHDAGMIVGDTDLLLGAAHTIAHLTGKRSGSDLDLADLRADLGESGLHADADVRRAADDVYEYIRADIHL